MSKLNLVNLAQAEIKKEEALKIKAGACSCSCYCPIDYRIRDAGPNLVDVAELA